MAAILTDLDGTFCDSDCKLSKATQLTYQSLINRIPIIPATGRGPASAKALVNHADSQDFPMKWVPGIYHHGALAFGLNGESDVLFEASVPIDAARKIVELVKDWAEETDQGLFSIFYYTRDEILTDVYSDKVAKFTDFWREPSQRVVENCLEMMETHKISLMKFAFVGDETETLNKIKELIELKAESLGLRVLRGTPVTIEVVRADVTKFQTAKIVFDKLRIPMDSVVSLGDGENDVEMLKGCRVSYAMGQAPMVVKSAAKFVAASNDEDGWAKAVVEVFGNSMEVEIRDRVKALF